MVYVSDGVSQYNRIFFPFSFGPFIGFWAALGGARRLGALAISRASMTSEQRLRQLTELGIPTIACTPTHALRLAEEAAKETINRPARACAGLFMKARVRSQHCRHPGGRRGRLRRRLIRPHRHDRTVAQPGSPAGATVGSASTSRTLHRLGSDRHQSGAMGIAFDPLSRWRSGLVKPGQSQCVSPFVKAGGTFEASR